MAYELARVLAHPLRDRLLFEYMGEPVSPSEVARRVGRPLNLVSYHTGVLLRHGCLELACTERRRGGTAHLYRSTVAQVIESGDWLEIPAHVRRALVRGLLATITDESHRAALDGGFDAAHVHLVRWPVSLDAEGAIAAERVLRGVIDELARIQDASDLRGGAARRHHVVLMGFEAGPEVAGQPPAASPRRPGRGYLRAPSVRER
jgi:hypothetical protein